jgi:signal transduction histidine kinase
VITVERLVERLEDKVAADEQREIELRAIRDELRGISRELAGVRVALERAAGGLEPPNQEPRLSIPPHTQPSSEDTS